MPPTNMEDDGGPTLTLQDALCMVSLLLNRWLIVVVFSCFFFFSSTNYFTIGDRRTPIDWQLTLTISLSFSSSFARLYQPPGNPDGLRA